MLFFGIVSGFKFIQNTTEKYLGNINNNIVLTEDSVRAIDFSLQPTEPRGISSILSMGSKALSYDKNKKSFSYKEFDNADSELFFKVVLVSNGSYMLQYEDRCVGVGEHEKLVLTECTDTSNVLHLNKSGINPNITIKNVAYNPYAEKANVSQLNVNTTSHDGITLTNPNISDHVNFGSEEARIPSHII